MRVVLGPPVRASPTTTPPISRNLPEHESASATTNCAFSGRINIGAKIVDTTRGAASIRTDRAPLSRPASRFSSDLLRGEGHGGRRLVTVVSTSRNCVLAARTRYARSTFIRNARRRPFVAVGDDRPNRRCFGPCPDLHDMVIFLDTRQPTPHERTHTRSLFLPPDLPSLPSVSHICGDCISILRPDQTRT